MFNSHWSLKTEGAEQRLRGALAAGEEVPVLGLRLRYDGGEILAVTVPSTVPPPYVSSGSAFGDMTGAEATLYVMEDADWPAQLLAERRVELRLTDADGKVWWIVERDAVRWPDGVTFPNTASTKWVG